MAHPKASVPIEGRTVRRRRPSQGQSTSSTSVSSVTRRNRAASATATKRAAQKGASAKSISSTSAIANGAAAIKDGILASRALTIAAIVVAVLLLALAIDTFSNMGKAYGNVSVGGVDVGGLNAEEMKSKLEDTYSTKLAGTDVAIYADEDAMKSGDAEKERRERVAQAEQVSAEEAATTAKSWMANGGSLGATLPYDDLVDAALSAGRAGGPFGRLAVMVAGENIPVTVSFDDKALDDFATTIDRAVGDQRVDATVEIEDGVAKPVKGHDGVIVDRAWLAGKLSDSMLSDEAAPIVAETVEAPSRTTYEQAQSASDGINKALKAGASFTYKNSSWRAEAAEIGAWTKVEVVEANGQSNIEPSIDATAATPSLVKNISVDPTTQSNENVTVTFEKTNEGAVVHTAGTGEIPEVVSAIEQLDASLYGPEGIARSASADPSGASIEIAESNAPETMTFEQAVGLGIITNIGEYTTEFSNEEGTENRNHNIKLVCDLLDNTVCQANGGRWSFNDHTGDTNMDPPFASAGSIVGGEYVDSIGGGVCQVATTVFNAVYEAGLDVVDRKNHSLFIASYPTGRDVGVSYPELDFVWANNLTSDVLMRTSYTDTTVTVKLYSVYTGYSVESIEGEWEEGEKYHTEFEEDSDLAKGDYYIKTTGEDGSRITVTRIVKNKSGEVISETEFESNYEPKNEVYLVGPGTDTGAIADGREPSSEESESEEEDSEFSDAESEESEASDAEASEEYDGYSDEESL